MNLVYKDESFWLSQKTMPHLFNCSTDNISLHLKNIFNEQELNHDSVTEEFSATATDGENYKTKFYNLDAIIAFGYRVNSHRNLKPKLAAGGNIEEEYIKRAFEGKLVSL